MNNPPFVWAQYDLCRDYDRLLSVIRSGLAVVALIDDDGLTRVVQCVAYHGMVDFRTQGVSYLTLFDDQMEWFNDWCKRKNVGWFVPCHEPQPVTPAAEPNKEGDL